MPTINEFITKLQQIKNELTKTRPEQAELIGREALALVRRRIQNEGKKANGQSLGSYSTTELPAFFSFGKSPTAAGEAAVRRAAKLGEKISYKDLRELNNRPTNFVNLTFTGAMWKEMAVQISSNTEERTIADIQPRTARSKKVAAFNSIRYGDILALSKDERDMLRRANFNRVLKIFRRILS